MYIPYASCTVIARGDNILAVRAECDTVQDASRSTRFRKNLAALSIPQSCRSVSAGCRHAPTIRAERGAVYTIRVSCEDELLFSRSRIPDTSGIVASSEHLCAILAKHGTT